MTDDKDTNQSPLVIRTVGSDGKAPKRRIASPAAAQGAYYSQRQMERTRDQRFGEIRNMYDGFPRIDPARMEEMGMGDMPNFNLKQFQYKIDQYADTWRRVNTAGTTWFDVRAKHPDTREALRRSGYLTECFNRAIRRWDDVGFCHSSGYILRCTARDLQMAMFGIGINHWRDHIDFRFEMRATRKVLVPFGTLLTLENCPVMFIEDDYVSVTQIYAMANKPGWNREAVMYALYLCTNQRNQPNLGRAWQYSEWENWLRNNEQWLCDTIFNPVRMVHCYVTEFTEDTNEQSITHTIFIDTATTGGSTYGGTYADGQKWDQGASKDKKKTGWLYEKVKCATRWSQIVSIYADNAGPEMEYHGVKGFGDLLFDLCDFETLMFNRTATSAILANMPIFTGVDENQRQRLNQVTVSFGAILFPDIGTMTQLKLGGDIASASGVFTLGNQLLDSISRTTPINEEMGPEKTATQASFERMAMTELTGLQISNYNATGNDATGAEMYRRIAQSGEKYPKSHPGGNVAAAFRKEALEYGIPESELLDIESVTATRKGGSGSMGVDIVKGKEALAIATPGSGQLFARKLIANAMFPPEVVSELIVEEAPPADAEDVVISQENLLIQNGQLPQAFDFQPHEKHLKQASNNDHLTILSGIEQVVNQMIKQGIQPGQLPDAVKLHNAFDSGIGHCMQHVEFLASMPRMGARPSMYEGFVKEITPVLNNMRQLSQAFAQTIAKAQEAEQQKPENMSPEMMKARAQIEIDAMKAEAEIERKNLSHQQKLGNMAEQSAVRTELKTQDAMQNLGTKAEQAALELQTKRAAAIQDATDKANQAQVDMVIQTAEAVNKQNNQPTPEQ